MIPTTISPPEMQEGDCIEFIDGFKDRFTVTSTEDPEDDPHPDFGAGVVWKVHGRDSRGVSTWFFCGSKSQHQLYERKDDKRKERSMGRCLHNPLP